MGTCSNKVTRKKGQETAKSTSVDLKVTTNHSILRFTSNISNMWVTGSYNQITIRSIRSHSTALGNIIVEGTGNKVRIERNARLVEVLGLNNAVTVGGKSEVGRIIILGREYGTVFRHRRNRKPNYKTKQLSPRPNLETDTDVSEGPETLEFSPWLTIN